MSETFAGRNFRDMTKSRNFYVSREETFAIDHISKFGGNKLSRLIPF